MVVLIVVPVISVTLHLALRQQIRRGQLYTGAVLQISCIYNFNRFQVFHVFYRHRKKDRARVTSHGSYANNPSLRGDRFNRLGIHLSLRTQYLDVGNFDRPLRLGFHDQLGLCRARLDSGLLHFRMDHDMGRLGEATFSVAFTWRKYNREFTSENLRENRICGGGELGKRVLQSYCQTRIVQNA